MSTETHVFFRGKPPSKAALARALRELEFPFTIPNAKGSLAQQHGFMPMKLRREETGVEFDLYDQTAIAEFAARGVDQSYERMASFRWGGDSEEAAAGLCGAAALAKLTNGVVFDEAEGRLLSASEAITVARQFLETLPKPASRHPGTRPVDIKRYLKPLLELRSDLVLRGRFLIIRPVRHILRGAVLDRTSDKYRFKIWRYIEFLYRASWDRLGLGDDLHVWCETWQPYFLPVLFDSLAEDAFDHVGQITSFAGLAESLKGTSRSHHARVQALLLAGQQDRAAQYVTELEREPNISRQMQIYIGELRTLLNRDIASLCAECHEKEAAAATTMKLGDIWEPSPFPVELPETEREAKSSEPIFMTTLWTRSSSVAQEAPHQPGDVRFATMAHRRNDRIVLLVPLTREEAERKHDNREDYALFARLPGQQLVVLKHMTRWSPHDPHQPKNPNYAPRRDFHLWIHGSTARILATFDGRFDEPNVLLMSSVDVRDHQKWTQKWYGYNVFREGHKSIYDDRENPTKHEKRVMTEADLDLCELQMPSFGEFFDLVRRATAYLDREGFGELPG